MYSLLDILKGCLPLALPFSFVNFGVKFMKKIIIEDTIKDLDKKVLFDYLIQNRLFNDNLSDEDIKRYKKIFSLYYRDRLRIKIKKFFHIDIIKNVEGS